MRDENVRVMVTRRNFVRGVGLLSAQAALAACTNGQEPSTGQAASEVSGQEATGSTGPAPLLAIIHTNDTHGHDVEVKATDNEPGNFSMAAVAALRKDWEDKGYEVLLVDAGDATQGAPLVDISSGEPAIAFMNSCGYDAMAVGNHEFDWGLEALDKNGEMATFPMLSANVTRKDTGELLFATNKVCELADGTLVGLFGLTTPETMTSTAPRNVSDVAFAAGDDIIACAQAQVDELRGKGCDLVVCLGHLGNDLSAGDSSSTAVLEGTHGIDLFIDGHDHREVEEEVNGTLLVETGCYLHNIGVVVIDEGVPQNDPVAYGTYDGIDAATQAIIDDEYGRVEEQLGVVLGETEFLLDGKRAPGLRTQETNLGDLVCDAFKWAAETELEHPVDAAISPGGGIRSSVDVGDITLGTVKTLLPFSNEIGVIEVTGEQLLEVLECGTQAVGTDNDISGFPQVAGITYVVNASVPYERGPVYPDTTYASPAAPGARVTITDVGGCGFDEDETYEIVTTSFAYTGGDIYHAFKDATDAKAPVVIGYDYEAVVGYLTGPLDHKVPDTYAEPQGRITIEGLG